MARGDFARGDVIRALFLLPLLCLAVLMTGQGFEAVIDLAPGSNGWKSAGRFSADPLHEKARPAEVDCRTG